MSVFSTLLFLCLAQSLKPGITFEEYILHMAKPRQNSESKNKSKPRRSYTCDLTALGGWLQRMVVYRS